MLVITQRFLSVVAAAFAAALLLCSCSGGSGQPVVTDARTELQRNRAKWTSQKIANYRYTFEIFSFLTATDGPYPVIVEVRNGVRTSVTEANSGKLLGAEAFSSFDTVEKLFQFIQNELDRNGATVSVTYDSRLGYPANINLDPNKDRPDDDSSLRVSNFQLIQ